MDETHLISDEVKAMAVKALKSIDEMPQGGVDVIIDPDDPKKCIVLEVNPTAEMTFHMYPIEGNPVNLAAAIIDYYFPKTKGKPKHNFYFDINDIDQALKSNIVDDVTVSQPTVTNQNVYEYEISLNNLTDAYLERVRITALKSGITGYVRKIDKKTAILILGLNKSSKLKTFINRIKINYARTTVNNIKRKRKLDKNTLMTRGFVVIND